MFRRFFRMTALTGLCVAGLPAIADNIKAGSDPAMQQLIWSGLRTERYGSLYTAGETVKFIAPGLPETLQSLSGTVYSADGGRVDAKTIDGADFKTDGWTWRPATAGLYEVEFHGLTAGGKTVRFLERYSIKIDRDEETFIRGRYAFGVVPQPVPMKERPALFGFSNQLEDLYIYPLADMLGLSFARIHSIGWGSQFSNTAQALEPEQGKYSWSTLDKHVNEMRKYGFTMVGNILYTPQWASPHPEKTNVNICVREFSSYAPVKMVYLEDFLKALIVRYGRDIKIWEIWNEPSLKGGSCFWSDTPENYFQLLKTASETLRREQPGTEIWLGSPDCRLYRIITRLGAAQYYDKLALHGSASDPLNFINIDLELGQKTKPRVCSEGHDILQREGPVEKNEAEIAAMLVQNILFKIKGGHERIAIFEFRNQAEMESLPFYGSHNRFTHASGLFRSRPLTEPRLAAIVYANLINQFKPGAKITAEYRLDKESLNLVQIDLPEQPPMLLLWNNGKQMAAMPEQLRQAMTAASIITDWEGKVAEKDKIAFVPGKVYYISGLNPQIMKILPRQEVIGSKAGSAVQAETPSALGSKGCLFDHVTGQLNDAKINWINSDWNFAGINGAARPDDFQAKYAIAGSEQGLDLVVSVKDLQTQFARPGDASLWNYDSVQFAIDTRVKRYFLDMVEIAVSSVNGEPVIIKTSTPELDGFLPTGFTPAGMPVKNAVAKISHAGGETLYRIHLEWSELFPYIYSPEKPLAFSLLVNNNNGAGRLGWLEWGSGIGKSKNIGAYGNIYFVNPSANLLEPPLSTGKNWTGWIADELKGKSSVALDDGKAIVTVAGTATNGSANLNHIQLIRDITLKNEQTYLLRFKANAVNSGRISIECLMSKPPWTRFAVSKCNLSAGERDYMVTIRPRNVQSLNADDLMSLRLFFGEMPAGTVTLSNAGLYRLSE